jgi:desumoylating isopeptidase 1
VISPEFKRLVEEKNADSTSTGIAHPKLLGLTVETSVARDISSHFEIVATPTFKFFLDGTPFAEFKGANRDDLKSNIDLLVYTAYPPHKHSKLALKSLVKLIKAPPIHFVASSNLDSISKKLKSFIEVSKVECSIARVDDIFGWLRVQDSTPTKFEPMLFETISNAD